MTLAAPADGHAVRVELVVDDAARGAQVRGHVVGDEGRVATFEPRKPVDVVALRVERRDDIETELLAELVVLGTAAGRDVDDARTLLGVDLLPRDHDVANGHLHREIGEEGLEFEADELGAVQLALHDVVGHAESLAAGRARGRARGLPTSTSS